MGRIRLLNQKYTLPEIWKLKKGLISPFFSPKKLFNFLLVQASYRLRLPGVRGIPYAVMIEPTSKCNLACTMCARTVYNLSGQGHDFPLSRYTRLIEDIGDRIIILSLWNYGEPLLNQNLSRMIALARKKKIFVMVTTNGTLLKGELADALISSGLHYLKISLDGTREATYRKFREGGSFEEVCENVASFCRRKKATGGKAPFVDLTFLVMKDNEQEMERARALGRDLSVDKISFRKIDPHYADDPEDVLPEKKEYRLPGYVPGGNHEKSVSPCSRVWTQAVINSDGTLYPCCLDLRLEHALGSIADGKTFSRLWNGEPYRAFRENQVRDPEGFAICRNCHARNFNQEVYIDD
jgi:radical SAM protein with 4Fe4S-binding SPASM domain